MKIRHFLLLPLCVCAATGCSNSATITIHNYDGTVTEHTVKYGEKFLLKGYLPNIGDDYFLGCYAASDGSGEQYVRLDGESIVWEKDYPTELYCCYKTITTLDIDSIELFDEEPYKFGGSVPDLVDLDEHNGFVMMFHPVYEVYFRNHADELFDLNVTFEHYEYTASIFVNWASYDIYLGNTDNLVASGSLASIDKYQTFDHTYQLTGKELAKGKGAVNIKISIPDGNLAKASGLWYRKFKAHIKPGVKLTKDDVSFEKNGKTFEYFADNGGFPLSKAAKNNGTTIPMPEIPSLLYQKYEPEKVTVTYLVKGGGKKTLGVFSNWATFDITAKDDKNKQVKKYSNSINDEVSDQDMEFEVEFTGEEFAKVQNFVYEFTHGGTAAAQEVYFIYYLGLRITFE